MEFREDQLVKTSTNRPGRSTIYCPLTKRFLFWGAGVFVLPITKVDPNAEYH
jgi:hypothetical protein